MKIKLWSGAKPTNFERLAWHFALRLNSRHFAPCRKMSSGLRFFPGECAPALSNLPQPRLDGAREQKVKTILKPSRAAKTETATAKSKTSSDRTASLSLGSAAFRPSGVLPQFRTTFESCGGPHFSLPEKRGRCQFCSKGCGRPGPRERSQVETPSLNPGLWYFRYPPIASRRQAKKREPTESGKAKTSLRSLRTMHCPATPISTAHFAIWMSRETESDSLGASASSRTCCLEGG